MKVSVVFLGSTGAGPVYSFEFARALANRKDCELQVIISKDCLNIDTWRTCFRDSNIEYHEIETYRKTPFCVALSFVQIWKTSKLVHLVKKFNPDYTFFPFGLVWSPIIFPQISSFSKIVTVIHDPHLHDEIRNPFKKYLSNLRERSNRYIDLIVILNKNDKEYMKEKYGKPVGVIPHASFCYYKGRLDDIHNNKINRKIGFFGRIEPYKGLDILVDAVNYVNLDIELLIAGKGCIDEVIMSKIKSNKNITLLNRYIDDDEFQQLLDQVDFVVLPYKRASQSGVIPMAFAFGKTVVATKVGALEEQVPLGTGVLCNPTCNDVAESIAYFYNNPELIFKYGKNAKEYAEKELSWEHSAELLLGFLEERNSIC